VLLRREGWHVNVKRVHWLYRLDDWKAANAAQTATPARDGQTA